MSGTQQPEALRLARKFEEVGFMGDHRFAKDHWCRQAAAELRRQHARIAELEDATDIAIERIAELEAERDEADRRAGRAERHMASLIEELQARGYDITTLKFSIQKKVTG